MKTRSHHNYQIAMSLGMIALLALAAFAPAVGGFLQQHHRVVQQGNLRRGRTDLLPVRIVLTDKAVADCFFLKKKELEFGGLRYDVISVRREGNLIVFNAIPDVKETRICAVTLRSILFPSGDIGQKMSFVQLSYLSNAEIMPLLGQFSNIARSVFFEEKAVKLAGFEWVFAPPPDVVKSVFYEKYFLTGLTGWAGS